ncbi:MAG: hypothetical protein WBA66_07830 [Xanthobacteraceae bacterium]
MVTRLLTCLAVLVVLVAGGLPAAAQNGRVPRHIVVPYDSNMSMIDRMARRNMERRHIERRMRLAPPPSAAPRRPGPPPRR